MHVCVLWSLQLEDYEWSFGYCERGTGVYCVKAKENPMYQYRETLELGPTLKSKQEVRTGTHTHTRTHTHTHTDGQTDSLKEIGHYRGLRDGVGQLFIQGTKIGHYRAGRQAGRQAGVCSSLPAGVEQLFVCKKASAP